MLKGLGGVREGGEPRRGHEEERRERPARMTPNGATVASRHKLKSQPHRRICTHENTHKPPKNTTTGKGGALLCKATAFTKP
jgi:hypothetical protein